MLLTRQMSTRRGGLVFGLLLAIAVFALAPAFTGEAAAQQRPAPELQQGPTGGQVPGESLGTTSDSDFWRAIRHGGQGTVSIPDKMAGQLIRSQGEEWRQWRMGPLPAYGVWILLGTIILLALFFLIRGRIRIESGYSGITITRFAFLERLGHWLLAVSFIWLGLTGLNLLYGRDAILPLIGPEAFGAVTYFGKITHNYVGFAFMAGLVLVFIMWVIHNFPNRHDLVWIAKGGGMFSKHSHPPAKKFNAGQKVIFWLVILGGVSLSMSGIALMFPFQFSMFADTFAVLNVFGFNLPTDLSPVREMQFAQLWHAIMAVFMIAVILAHIYIGTIGMQGAFDAMGSGEVDLNWAREHHSLWVDEVQASQTGEPRPAPAGAAVSPVDGGTGESRRTKA